MDVYAVGLVRAITSSIPLVSFSYLLSNGMIRINFQPYTTQQLEQIVHARLRDAKEGLEEPPDVINADGVKFAAMKVSSISGDARRVLDICRYVSGLVPQR